MAYVYRHIRLDKNEPFYIGVGEIERRAKVNYGRNKLWSYIAKKTEYDIEIIMDGLSWDEACQKEIEFIKLYGRIDKNTGTLANFTDGGEGRPIHNFCKFPLFNTWNNIKKVCSPGYHKRNKDYFDKGIRMCKEWEGNFMNFNKWALDNGWDETKKVSRKDFSKWFTPDNCEITDKNFKRKGTTHKRDYNLVKIVRNGREYTIKELCNQFNIPIWLFRGRRTDGWDIEKIISTPLAESKRNKNTKIKNNYNGNTSH